MYKHLRETYILTAVGMGTAFRLLIAFLLSNHLLENKHLYFFGWSLKHTQMH